MYMHDDDQSNLQFSIQNMKKYKSRMKYQKQIRVHLTKFLTAVKMVVGIPKRILQ